MFDVKNYQYILALMNKQETKMVILMIYINLE